MNDMEQGAERHKDADFDDYAAKYSNEERLAHQTLRGPIGLEENKKNKHVIQRQYPLKQITHAPIRALSAAVAESEVCVVAEAGEEPKQHNEEVIPPRALQVPEDEIIDAKEDGHGQREEPPFVNGRGGVQVLMRLQGFAPHLKHILLPPPLEALAPCLLACKPKVPSARSRE
mmetsp:Transcript_78833/g.154744  ORF Transcript_78833/g.154744 Transcript_78833/m.154744 type:complete len:173 (+) Transcript_78833:736-1254(+)